MNPSPAELWLREQAVRFCNRLPDQPLEATWLSDPRFLRRAANNPVARPDGACAPHWFDVKHTAEGLAIANALGPNSGYFQEYASWAPSVSWLFDSVAGIVELLAHPHLPSHIRDLFLPYLYAQVQIVGAQHSLLALQRIHAHQKGTGLEGSWRALQAGIRANALDSRFKTDEIDGALEKFKKELFTQELKLTTKHAAARRTQSASSSGAAPAPSNPAGRGRGRGRNAAPPKPE